eukprot:3042634-Rhodomonas_salina.1
MRPRFVLLLASTLQCADAFTSSIAFKLPTARSAGLRHVSALPGGLRVSTRGQRKCTLSTVCAAGGLQKFMSEPDPPPESVLRAVEALGGRVTVGDVASKAGMSVEEAKKQLTVLAQLAEGNLEVSNEGELVYSFDGSFRSTLSARSAKRRAQEAWDKVAPLAYYLLKVSFGVALITSIALIFTAILVIQSSSRDERDERRSSFGGGGGFGMGPSFWWGPTPFDFFYFNAYSPYGVNRYEEPGKMSFLEAVFSFLFGDGDPNEKLDQRRSQAVARLVREQGGSVIAEQLAPYMDPPKEFDPTEDRVDEAFILPAITELGGTPEVTEEGNIIYTFEDLQVSAAPEIETQCSGLKVHVPAIIGGTSGHQHKCKALERCPRKIRERTLRRACQRVSAAGTGSVLESLKGQSAQELKQLASAQGVSTAGLYDKDDLVASLNVSAAVLAKREAEGSGAQSRLGAFLEERQYEFSLASQGQVPCRLAHVMCAECRLRVSMCRGCGSACAECRLRVSMSVECLRQTVEGPQADIVAACDASLSR